MSKTPPVIFLDMQGGAVHGFYLNEALAKLLPPDLTIVIGDDEEGAPTNAIALTGVQRDRYMSTHVAAVLTRPKDEAFLLDAEASAISSLANLHTEQRKSGLIG